MKRIKLILSMLLVALLLPIGAWAQSYDFSFCGVEVNASNCSDIPVAGMSGKASFVDATNTLTLDNVSYDGNGAAIYFFINCHEPKDLTIKLIGENVFTNTGQAIALGGDCYFIGEGEGASITLSGRWDQVRGNKITIDNCGVKAITTDKEEEGSPVKCFLTLTVTNNGWLRAETAAKGVSAIALYQPQITNLFMDSNMSILPKGTTKATAMDPYMEANASMFFYGDEPASLVFLGREEDFGESGGGEEQSTSGTTGNLKWKVEKLEGTAIAWRPGKGEEKLPTYRLIISGDGDMPNYNWTGRDDNTGRAIYDTPWYAFEAIREIVIDEGVRSIGEYASSRNDFLYSVKLPSSLKRIEYSAFSLSALSSVNFPEGLESIGDYAFSTCQSLTSVSLPSTLTNLAVTSFGSNCLQNLTIAAGNKKFDSRDNCNAIILTDENKLFIGTPATVIPATVTSIGDNAFFDIDLTSFVIPNGVKTIGVRAFNACSQITSLAIGSGVTSIGEKAFGGTLRLADVYFYANPAKLEWADYDYDSNFMKEKATKIHVPSNYLATWQAKFPNINATFVGDLDGGEAEDEGDANGDGEIDVADIDFVIEHIGEPIDDTNRASDVNGDGEINVADVDYIIERIK